jgi:hypothetical protein
LPDSEAIAMPQRLRPRREAAKARPALSSILAYEQDSVPRVEILNEGESFFELESVVPGGDGGILREAEGAPGPTPQDELPGSEGVGLRLSFSPHMDEIHRDRSRLDGWVELAVERLSAVVAHPEDIRSDPAGRAEDLGIPGMPVSAGGAGAVREQTASAIRTEVHSSSLGLTGRYRAAR